MATINDTDPVLVPLPGRGLITIAGTDRVSYLQGLVSNDVTRVDERHGVWTALLSPQGKYLHDFLIVASGEVLLLDCEGGDRMMDLGRTLHRFKLHSDVALGMARDWSCYHIVNAGMTSPLGEALTGLTDTVAFDDPRHDQAGIRIISKLGADALAEKLGIGLGAEGDYASTRIALGIPEGQQDMEPGKAILLENGFDELGGIDWSKGCYMGQELTARTKYRGLVKKRLVPITGLEESDLPLKSGDVITFQGKSVGDIKSSTGSTALALVRLDALNAAETGDASLLCGERAVAAQLPDWINLDQNAQKHKGV